MPKFRMRFSKQGRAIYISHLDLMHTMQRAFSRAGYELNYSEGFNPHPCISIALPLGVGTSSQCEIMDFSLKNDDIEIEKLNEKLPKGIKVLDIYVPEMKISELRYVKVKGRLEFVSNYPNLCDFYSRESICISKKAKKGISIIDIKPMIKDISFDGCYLYAIISAQNPTLNPDLLIDAIRQLKPEDAPTFAIFEREEIYDEDMKVFR